MTHWGAPIAFAIVAQLRLYHLEAHAFCANLSCIKITAYRTIYHQIIQTICVVIAISMPCVRVCISITKRFTECLLKSDYTKHTCLVNMPQNDNKQDK